MVKGTVNELGLDTTDYNIGCGEVLKILQKYNMTPEDEKAVMEYVYYLEEEHAFCDDDD